MRRLKPALLLLVLLPGCFLAIGNDGLDGKKTMRRLERLEHRVTVLEDQLGYGVVDDDFEDDEDAHAHDHGGPAMRP